MQPAQTLAVSFQNSELFLVDNCGQPFVPMKPVVEGMGLTWQGQHVKLTQGRFKTCITEIVIQLPGDTQNRPVTCLPLRKLNGWFMSIHPNKVTPELREGIIAYQNECDDALWAYWNDQRATAVQTTPAPAIPEIQPIFAQRWITTFDTSGNQHTRLLPMDKCIMNTPEFIDHVSHLSESDIPTPQLLQLTMKLMSQLGKRNLNFAGFAI